MNISLNAIRVHLIVMCSRKLTYYIYIHGSGGVYQARNSWNISGCRLCAPPPWLASNFSGFSHNDASIDPVVCHARVASMKKIAWEPKYKGRAENKKTFKIIWKFESRLSILIWRKVHKLEYHVLPNIWIFCAFFSNLNPNYFKNVNYGFKIWNPTLPKIEFHVFNQVL